MYAWQVCSNEQNLDVILVSPCLIQVAESFSVLSFLVASRNQGRPLLNPVGYWALDTNRAISVPASCRGLRVTLWSLGLQSATAKQAMQCLSSVCEGRHWVIAQRHRTFWKHYLELKAIKLFSLLMICCNISMNLCLCEISWKCCPVRAVLFMCDRYKSKLKGCFWFQLWARMRNSLINFYGNWNCEVTACRAEHCGGINQLPGVIRAVFI